MKIKDNIKIRAEDGFYLLINLDEKSILNGYPSFFKINKMAKEIIDYMRAEVAIEDILDFCLQKSVFYENQKEKIVRFINFLRKADLICE